MNTALRETTPRALAERALIAARAARWDVLVVEPEQLTEQVLRLKQAIEESGFPSVEARVSRGTEAVPAEAARKADCALILIGEDADAQTWQLMDMRRTAFTHRGATFLILVSRAVESFTHHAPHLFSWISGNMWTAAKPDADDRLHEGRVGPARAALPKGHLAEALKPPTTSVGRPATSKGDFAANAAWLRVHRTDYTGKWVAVRNGALVDSDESRIALQRRLETDPELRNTLFVKVDEQHG